jgi:5-oxoprolinase (ATP-hydrolysing)
VLESRFPVRVDEFSIRRGSGGQGAYKGGDGITRKLAFLEPMTVTVLSSHRITEPAGSMGGGAGKRGENMIARQDGSVEELKGNDAAQMREGDVFIMHTPGGGGYFKIP